MSVVAALPTLAAFTAALLGTLLLRRALLQRAMLDRPNERSSHSAPVARGGGAVFVLIAVVWLACTALPGGLPGAGATAVACLAVAAIGWVDDARGVPARTRLAVHLAAAACMVWFTTAGALPASHDAWALPAWAAWLGLALLVVAAAWMVNLVNFMDGIDGIAGTQGVFVLGSAAVVSALHPETAGPAVSVLPPLAAAVAGFLVVNVSRFKVFMGDVGSGTLGLLTAWALLAAVVAGALTPWAAGILPAVFVADATVTLAVRVLRGQRPAQAHRTHAYQRLQRAGRTHLGVTCTYAAVNCMVVLPAALLAEHHPAWGAAIAAGVYAALAIAAFCAGAGREP